MGEGREEMEAALDRFLDRWAYVCPANMEPFAARMARWLGLSEPPRLAADTLRALGVRLSREALPAGMSAVWAVEEGCYHIRLSPFLSGPRANFTLWHEWFEIVAARPAFPTPLAGRAAERAADRFAACLTMPAPEIRRAAHGLRGAGDKANVLAARFGVSAGAMRRRLHELHLVPFGPADWRVPDVI
jgi:hypothetical protein